jgi:hypothetical protein
VSNQRIGESNIPPGQGGRRGRGRGRRPRGGNGQRDPRLMGGRPMDYPEEEPFEDEIDDDSDGAERMNVSDIKLKSMQELTELAESLAVENAAGLRKQDLIFQILSAQTAKQGKIYTEGVLETLPDGFGFLRAPDQNYLAGPTTSTCRRRRSAVSRCGPATPSWDRSGRRRRASATSPCSRSTRSTSSRPRRRATRSCSTT